MSKRLHKRKAAATGFLLALLILPSAFAGGGTLGVSAADAPATDGDTVETVVSRKEISYSGTAFKGLGTSKNDKVVLSLDLTGDGETGIPLPNGANEWFLTVSFTGLRNTESPAANAADSIATVFFLEDGAGNRADTRYVQNPNYSVPALQYKEGNVSYAFAQLNNVGMYYRKNSNSQLTDGTALIPFSVMNHYTADGSVSQTVTLQNIKYLMFSHDLGNPWRWVELLDIGITTLPDMEADLTNGMVFNADGTIPGASRVDALYKANKTVLYDFTALTNERIAANFADGTFTTMVTNDRNSIARESCTAAQNSTYLDRMALERTYEQVTETVYVNVKAPLTGALKIVPNPDSLGTIDTDSAAPNYDIIKNAFLDVWSGTTVDVSRSDGLAFTLMGLSSNAAFRLYLYDTSGRVYYVGVDTSQNAPYHMPFLLNNGEKTVLRSYSKFVWADQKAGTAYIPYDALTQVTDKKLNGADVNTAKSRIANICKVGVALDNSQKNFPGVLNRKFVLGSVADVNVGSETVTRIFDTSAYTYAADASDTTCDVNPLDPMAGKTVVPNSRNDAAEPQDWKNEAWLLGKATAFDLLYRTNVQTPYIGDVRIYEDFALPSGGDTLTAEEKDAFLNKIVVTNGATSYFNWYDNSEYGYGDAMLWTIGDYVSEFVSGMSANASWYTDSGLLRSFGSLKAKNALGETITPKGVTLFVINTRSYAIDMNFEVEFTTEMNGETKRERWECCMPGSEVFAFDMASGREFRMPSTSHATQSTVSIPAGFAGWIRLPFSSMYFPSWLVGDGGYASDGVINFDDTLLRFFINCNMNRNSTAGIVLDNYGFYYADFEVSSSFHAGGPGIADCLALTDYFAA